MAEVFKTCLFKIHNPSKRRRAMLLDCLRRNERAYWKILDNVKPDAEEDAVMAKKVAAATDAFKIEFKQRKQAKRSIESAQEMHWKEQMLHLRQLRKDKASSVRKKIAQLLVSLPLPASSKGGIEIDSLAQIKSTSELLVSGQEANWPLRRPIEDPYLDGLDAMCKAVSTEELTCAADLMNTKPRDTDSVRPMSIYRNDTKLARSTLLLEDDKKRIFVWLNLHDSKSRFAKVVHIKDMTNLRTGEVLNRRSSAGDLFPLECSKWHLDKFVQDGIMQSSKLIYRNNEFFVACTFKLSAEDIDTTNYLGVDRGIEKLAAWAVVTPELKVLAEGDAEGSTLRDYQRAAEQRFKQTQSKKGFSGMKWRAFGDHAIHSLANEIVKQALKYKCQVVLEDLKAITQGHHHKRTKGQRRSNFAKMLNRAQYAKLEGFLEYKLTAVGLPTPLKVRAAFTSQGCNKCGHSHKDNRLDQATFKCVSCGHEDNADSNAAKNIASKYIYWREIGPKVSGKKMQDKYKFDSWMKQRRNVAV